MPNYSKKIIYLSQAQYQELITNDTITVNGVTVNYNENDIYVTPQAEPITDVKINGNSIGSNGVADIPVASTDRYGVIMVGDSFSISSSTNKMILSRASDIQVKNGSNYINAIVPLSQHASTFYGLAKASGDTSQASSSNAVGTYTDTAKQKIQNMLGITDLISTEETTTATAAHSINSTFIMGGKLHRATAAIAIGDAVEVGTNCEEISLTQYINNTYALKNHTILTGSLSLGRKANSTIGGNSVAIGYDNIASSWCSAAIGDSNNSTSQCSFATGEYNTASGMSSYAGGEHTTSSGMASSTHGFQTIANSGMMFAIGELNIQDTLYSDWVSGTSYNVGDKVIRNGTSYECKNANNDDTWTSSNWTNIFPRNGNTVFVIGNGMYGGARSNALKVDWDGNGFFNGNLYVNCNANSTGGTKVATINDIPNVPVQDVQINGTSILSNGIANIPLADDTHTGAVKIHSDYGWGTTQDGYLRANGASTYQMRHGADFYRPIVSANQHISVFYALAKIAGHDEKDSPESVGTYTGAAKQAIQNMLGITDLLSTEESSTATATHALNSTFLMSGKLHRTTAAIAIGDAVVVGTNCEVVKADEVFVKKTDYATSSTVGLVKPMPYSGIAVDSAGQLYLQAATAIKAGTEMSKPLVPFIQHQAVFYGLSKVAGVDLANETVTLGTYPETSKTAIRTLIGAGTPLDVQINESSIVSSGIANIPVANSSALGVVKVNSSRGISIFTDGTLGIAYADSNDIKGANSNYKPITPSREHEAVFYGLAYAAGDTTQQPSTNSIGSYTNNAKAAIQSMLGISSLFAPTETELSNATQAYSVGSIFTMNGKLYKATSAIAINDLISTSVNCSESSISDAFAAKTDTVLNTTLSIGRKTDTIIGENSVAIGLNVVASGHRSVAFGAGSQALASESIAEGSSGFSLNTSAHSEGQFTVAAGICAHAEGGGLTISTAFRLTGQANTTQYTYTNVSDSNIHIGDIVIYNSYYGIITEIDTINKIITLDSTLKDALDGTNCYLRGSYAKGNYSHTEGLASIASSNYQHVEGKYNMPDNASTYAAIIGNGSYGSRSNAYALDWSGNGHYAGNIYVGCNSDSTGGIRVPHDVQINGSSIVSNGVANIPVAGPNFGVVKINSNFGIDILNGFLYMKNANASQIKGGTHATNPITPNLQDQSVFYGLAKAAGDTTQAASDNAVGTYTAEAKAAIHTMLGIDPASIAAQVDIPLVETVSGTTPTITGQPNVRYVCGEVSTISITPPASGSVDVIFESGSTAAVLTVPNTVKWPAWFDATTLEADTTYEILITDGIYGSVMTWAT